MALDYYDRDEALAVINQWVLDGSRIESWGADNSCEWINLRGSDGCLEDFVIYF